MREAIAAAGAETLLGKTASYPARVRLPVFAAPTTTDAFNATQATLRPVACWQINAPGFDLDSSFLLPSMRDEILRFAELVERHPDAPASIFGHADSQGDDAYNKWLSGRRASAVYGLLARDVDQWLRIYRTHVKNGGDVWGMRHVQQCLSLVQAPEGAPYYEGPLSDSGSSATKKALRHFQSDNGLGATGNLDAATLKALFLAYMDALCTDPETGKVLKLEPEAFLGKGADESGKASYQGCGEFNPVIVVGTQEGNGKEQDEAFAKNRRVVVYMFEPGTRIEPPSWPCPSASEGVAGCKKRFWSDADKRKNRGAETRAFDATQDTFGCRFYQRIATDSPCEMPSSARTTLDLYLDHSLEAEDAQVTYTLSSDDGVYSKSMTGGQAFQLQTSLFAIRFTGVLRARKYTLTKMFKEGAVFPLFIDVPFDAIGGSEVMDTE